MFPQARIVKPLTKLYKLFCNIIGLTNLTKGIVPSNDKAWDEVTPLRPSSPDDLPFGGKLHFAEMYDLPFPGLSY